MVRVLVWPQSGFIRVEPNLVEICTNLRHFRYYWSLTRLKLESENETRVRKLTQLTRVTRLDLQTLLISTISLFEFPRYEVWLQAVQALWKGGGSIEYVWIFVDCGRRGILISRRRGTKKKIGQPSPRALLPLASQSFSRHINLVQFSFTSAPFRSGAFYFGEN